MCWEEGAQVEGRLAWLGKAVIVMIAQLVPIIQAQRRLTEIEAKSFFFFFITLQEECANRIPKGDSYWVVRSGTDNRKRSKARRVSGVE